MESAFCTRCGAALEATCPHCGQTNPGGSNFCGRCGHRFELGAAPVARTPRSYTPDHLARKILRDRARLEGERRNVTVLFADATGFTSLSEQLNPERVYDLMQGCLARMMDAVHRYEGTVTHFTGDGLMALFGAPIAHEDSARRAVLAALELQSSLEEYAAEVNRTLPIQCRFRVGLNTGPVVVGKISDDLDMDYTAIGDTVNLASRMEQLADPGTVVLTQATHRVVRDFIECEPLGAATVKGKAEPVECYRVVGEKAIRTRFEAATERGLTPFVGRTREVEMLVSFYNRAAEGRGQAVLVSGEAGLGKSRLLLECRRRLAVEGPEWLEGHCISYGKQIPYLPIAELLRRHFAIQEGDPESSVVEKVEAATGAWGDGSRATVPYLRFLLNVDPGDAKIAAMDAMARRAGILDSLRAFLVEASRARPLIVVIEDLHWIDERAEEALRSLADVIPSLPILFMLTYRPGYVTTLGERSYFNRIALAPLPPEDSATVIRGLLESAHLPAELHRIVGSKAEGNPFYIEEVTRSLLETGALRRRNGDYVLARAPEDIDIPDTIQEVILSRLDRLEREAREAMQLASVIGREFTVRLLDRISKLETNLDDVLQGLRSLELIYEKSYFPELAYMFKHALIHDVAYATLLETRRRALHRLIGAAIEELYADRLAEHHETLAHHFSEGEAWPKALEYSLKAAQKAAAAYANHEALAYYDRALTAAARLPEMPVATLMGIYHGKAEVCLTIDDWRGVVENFDKMCSAARTAGDRRGEGLALAGVAVGLMWSHDFPGSEIAAREALAIGDAGEDESVRAAALTVLALLDALRGNIESAAEQLPTSIQLSEETGLALYELFGRSFEVLIHEWRGDYEIAELRAREAVEASRRYGATFMLLFNMWIEALVLGSRGRYAESTRLLNETIALCERMGERAIQSRAWNTLGWMANELGAWKRAVYYNRRGLTLAKESGDPEITINAQINLADVALGTGQTARGKRYLSALYTVLPERHEWMKWRYSQHLIHSLGRAELAVGDLSAAERLAMECLELAERTGSLKNVAKARRLLGQARLGMGRSDEALAELGWALAAARRAENPPQVWKTYATMGDLFSARERDAEARDAHAEARAAIERVAQGLDDDELRAGLLAAPPIERIVR